MWQQRIAIRVTAMIRAGNRVFAAGTPDVVVPEDPLAAYDGRRAGVLAVFAAKDGKKLAEHRLPAPPVWDGMAAARGRLYLSLCDGTLVCMSEAGPAGDPM